MTAPPPSGCQRGWAGPGCVLVCLWLSVKMIETGYQKYICLGDILAMMQMAPTDSGMNLMSRRKNLVVEVEQESNQAEAGERMDPLA
jgi:hypothetical protein